MNNMRYDYPNITAQYIVYNNARKVNIRDPFMNCSKKTVHDVKITARRIERLYDFHLKKKTTRCTILVGNIGGR